MTDQNAMTKKRTIALVGHCGPDAYMLRSTVSTILKAGDVAMVNDDESLTSVATRGNLLLINRVLDGRFAAASGLALIATLAGQPDPPTMMLVSNFEEAQREAQARGAHPGFGKAEVGRKHTAQRLIDAFGAD